MPVPHTDEVVPSHALSLLSARRPSLAGTAESLAPLHVPNPESSSRADEDFFRSSSAQESRPNVPDFSRGLEIKMQAWVGDGSCKMSISPSGRDVVLAARSGLYIIDLEAPLEVPRFLPQGGTWDVADVQWNPHPFRSNYVVSTSSEKLLIWNLDRPDRESIQFILPCHYRSITDLNWHNQNPEIVASTSIDSWIWLWDLRTPAKPVTGLCAFNPGATQVKWSRHDENILASSHGSALLIWDQRKGAVPLKRINAHTARIYGIDWSRLDRYEIASCSLDQTIKFWNTSTADLGIGDAILRPLTEPSTHTSPRLIRTKYPVWRARHVPFGSGVLSLPLRGIQRPELYYEDKPFRIIPEHNTDERPADVIKEYVWRTKNGYNVDFDDREFQLVTWSEDRTLRAWTIDVSTLERAGFVHGARIEDPSHRPTYDYNSYRAVELPVEDVPHTAKEKSTFGGIRVGRATALDNKYLDGLPSHRETKSVETIPRGGTMTKGTGRSIRRNLHALEWMPSVIVKGKKEGGIPINLDSAYIGMEQSENPGNPSLQDPRSWSPQVTPSNDTPVESETSPSWAEELTSVINGLSNSKTFKIALEKMDIKTRTCTLGFQGPWGENSSVFTRITFTFPRDYPRFTTPGSLLRFDLERNHLIPVKRRAFLLRELRNLCKRPPCLEACLRFLLGLPIRRGVSGHVLNADSGSSSEEDNIAAKSNREASIAMRGQTGLAEPRTSQGIFAPTGEMVFFSHLQLRMVQTSADSPSRRVSSSARDTTDVNQTSGMLSDALRRLTAAAYDRHTAPSVATGADEDLIRTLESLVQPKSHSSSENPQANDVRDSTFLVRPTRKSRITIRDISEITGIDKVVALEYMLSTADPEMFCLSNANIARAFGRVDHERIFMALHSLFTPPLGSIQTCVADWRRSPLSRKLIWSYVNDLRVKRDIVMLAMMSLILLSAEDRFPNSTASYVPQLTLHPPVTSCSSNSVAPSISSQSSWPSFTNGVQTPVGEPDGSVTPRPERSPIPRTLLRTSDTRHQTVAFDNVSIDDSSPLDGSKKHARAFKSWSEPGASTIQNPTRVPIHVGQHRSHETMYYLQPGRLVQKHLSVTMHTDMAKADMQGDDLLLLHLFEYVIALAEFFFRWRHFSRRLELLKHLPRSLSNKLMPDGNGSNEGLMPVFLCKCCGNQLSDAPANYCKTCGPRSEKPACTVCRLPTSGLAHVCLSCLHSTHLRCWQSRRINLCPSGCGCDCFAGSGFEANTAEPKLPL